MVATNPGKRWKQVALDKLAACDIVLHNRVPRPAGDLAAPAAFLQAAPLECDLSCDRDAGTLAYVARLQSAFRPTKRQSVSSAQRPAN